MKCLSSWHLELVIPFPRPLVGGLAHRATCVTQTLHVEVQMRTSSGGTRAGRGRGGLPGTECSAMFFVELTKEWTDVTLAVPGGLHILDHTIHPLMKITSPFISEKMEAQRGEGSCPRAQSQACRIWVSTLLASVRGGHRTAKGQPSWCHQWP